MVFYLPRCCSEARLMGSREDVWRADLLHCYGPEWDEVIGDRQYGDVVSRRGRHDGEGGVAMFFVGKDGFERLADVQQRWNDVAACYSKNG
jgi:hypothetical protein